MVENKENKDNKDNKDKYYVTTAIDYVNAEPHIGHAYQKVVADVLARWNKLKGREVRFLTGTDEHGQKTADSAEKEGVSPKEFVDEMSSRFKEAWASLDVDYDRFIRTTDKDHKKFVQEFIKKLDKNDQLYKGEYEGLYCVGCEEYKTEKDLEDGKCPLHQDREIEKVKEEAYFFKLSDYEDELLELYKRDDFVLPEFRKNEMKNFVKEGLRDLSITRRKESLEWGIPFPLDDNHVVYVWADALLNYLSGSGKNQEYWPANDHLLGKDNGRFHAVIWPAMLLGAGYELPKTVFIHGFLNMDKGKISKSSGDTVSPQELVGKYGSDSVRYYLCRNFVFGRDGDFSERNLVNRHNNELANKLGNLVSRVSSLAEKYGLEKAEGDLTGDTVDKVGEYMENYQFDKALNEIFSLIDKVNEYIQNEKPWESEDSQVLYKAANAIKKVAILLWPFIPSTSEKIADVFNFDIEWKNIGSQLRVSKVKKSGILFEKKEAPKDEGQEEDGKDKVSFKDWQKLDLRVGEIKKVEELTGSDKLYKLKVDIGEERQLVAGLKKHYKEEELEGKECVVFTNLEPSEIMGVKSEGMVLAVGGKEVRLLEPDGEIETGSEVE